MKKFLYILSILLMLAGIFSILSGADLLRIITLHHHLRYIIGGIAFTVLGIALCIRVYKKKTVLPVFYKGRVTLHDHRDRSWLKQPEFVFLIIALLSGAFLCFLIPNQAGFDEGDHMAYIWELSNGYFIPNQGLSKGPYYPGAFADISYRNQRFYYPVDPNYFAIYGNERIDLSVFLDYQTRSSYLPTLYLPQAFVMGLLGRIYNAPALVIFYTCRALYLLGYILLTFFAIRLISYGKWLLAVLALAPMAMFQASTVSPDAYTNGACFLFLAWMLKLAFQDQPIGWRQFWVTVGVTTLLLSVKLDGAFLLPLFLLLFWKSFQSKKMLPLLGAAVLFLFSVLSIGWNLLVYSTFYQNRSGYSIAGQLSFIATHLVQFGGIFLRNIISNGFIYLRDWIASYGYGDAHVPTITYLPFLLALAIAWLFSAPSRPIAIRTRLILIFGGIFGSICTILIFYLTLNLVGATTIGNVLGRHFVPILPLLIFGLVPGRMLVSRKAVWLALAALGIGAVLALAFFMSGIYLSFYTYCGASLYTPGLCYQPHYKNWDRNAYSTPPVTQNVTLEQSFEAQCSPFHTIRVWNNSPALTMPGETMFTLKSGDGSVLSNVLVSNRSIAGLGWVEVSFPPIIDATGKQFEIVITSDVVEAKSALSFDVSDRRYYRWGMSVNGEPEEDDLIFQYGCAPLTLSDLIHQKP